MGSAPSVPSEKKVVIVGGGYAGTKVALALKKKQVDYTIIDVHTHMYHNIASIRSVVQPDFSRSLLIPYQQTFGKNFKQGRVSGVRHADKKVVLEGGEEIDYDVLVIATGSTTFSPFKRSVENTDTEALIQHSTDTANKVKNAKEVVIIGGGPVGCEVAGEIRTDFKDVKVTIIQSANFLVTDTLGEKFQSSVQDKLRKLGVNLVLEERVSEGLQDKGVYGPCQVVTDKGNTFNADLVFRCTGAKVNSQAYADSLSSVTTESGSLQVNEFLQVAGHTDIFALGDCTDLPEMKLAYRVGEQVPIVLHNIAAIFKETKLKHYDPNSITMGIALSIGRNDGVGAKTNGGLLPSFLIKLLKSRKLMVPDTWSEMKQKQPKS